MTTSASPDVMIKAYVQLRDMKKDLADRHKEEMKPINEKMAILEAGLLRALNQTGSESIKTKYGTTYLIDRKSVKIEDWDTTLDHIMKHGLWHMLERRLAKSAVDEYIEANDAAPPGVSISTDTTIGVRRSSN